MRHVPYLLFTIAVGAAVGAACGTPAGEHFDDSDGGAGADGSRSDGSSGSPTDGSSGSPTDGSSGPHLDGGTPSDGASPIADGGDGVIDFEGGWHIPDAGQNPALVGDGGSTIEIGPGASAGATGSFGGLPDPSAAPTIVYPPDGVILPPNTNSIEFHFIPAAGQTLFKFTFQAPTTSLEVYVGCTPVGAGCIYTPDATFWSSLVAYARGTAPVTYTLSGVNGASPGAVGTSSQSSIAFGQQNMTGGVYYWNTQGVIQRYDYGVPNAPAQTYLTPADVGAFACVGCHVISREGYLIVAGKDIPSPAPYSVLSVPTKAPLMGASGPVGGSANFFSFSPDEKQLLTSDGVSVGWQSLTTGAVVNPSVASPATMPDWSPDGLHMVYAKSSSPAFFPLPGVSSASIAMMHFNGVGWDDPTTLVPFAGQNNYYPAFSPDGNWVAFNRSPSNAESFSNASPDPDAGTVPDGELWAVPSGGGAAVRLSHASDPGACSWPKWAPVLHDYSGGKIMWLTFSSARAYGLRLAAGQQTQIWMVAFDPARVGAGQDPTFPAFWLPFQDINGGNHIAQWATAVRR